MYRYLASAVLVVLSVLPLAQGFSTCSFGVYISSASSANHNQGSGGVAVSGFYRPALSSEGYQYVRSDGAFVISLDRETDVWTLSLVADGSIAYTADTSGTGWEFGEFPALDWTIGSDNVAAEVLAAGDVGCSLPSLEQCGLAVTEASAAGVPEAIVEAQPLGDGELVKGLALMGPFDFTGLWVASSSPEYPPVFQQGSALLSYNNGRWQITRSGALQYYAESSNPSNVPPLWYSAQGEDIAVHVSCATSVTSPNPSSPECSYLKVNTSFAQVGGIYRRARSSSADVSFVEAASPDVASRLVYTTLQDGRITWQLKDYMNAIQFSGIGHITDVPPVMIDPPYSATPFADQIWWHFQCFDATPVNPYFTCGSVVVRNTGEDELLGADGRYTWNPSLLRYELLVDQLGNTEVIRALEFFPSSNAAPAWELSSPQRFNSPLYSGFGSPRGFPVPNDWVAAIDEVTNAMAAAEQHLPVLQCHDYATLLEDCQEGIIIENADDIAGVYRAQGVAIAEGGWGSYAGGSYAAGSAHSIDGSVYTSLSPQSAYFHFTNDESGFVFYDSADTLLHVSGAVAADELPSVFRRNVLDTGAGTMASSMPPTLSCALPLGVQVATCSNGILVSPPVARETAAITAILGADAAAPSATAQAIAGAYTKAVDSAGDYFLRSTPSTGGSSIALRHDGTKWEFIDVDTTTVLLQQVVGTETSASRLPGAGVSMWTDPGAADEDQLSIACAPTPINTANPYSAALDIAYPAAAGSSVASRFLLNDAGSFDSIDGLQQLRYGIEERWVVFDTSSGNIIDTAPSHGAVVGSAMGKNGIAQVLPLPTFNFQDAADTNAAGHCAAGITVQGSFDITGVYSLDSVDGSSWAATLVVRGTVMEVSIDFLPDEHLWVISGGGAPLYAGTGTRAAGPPVWFPWTPADTMPVTLTDFTAAVAALNFNDPEDAALLFPFTVDCASAKPLVSQCQRLLVGDTASTLRSGEGIGLYVRQYSVDDGRYYFQHATDAFEMHFNDALLQWELRTTGGTVYFTGGAASSAVFPVAALLDATAAPSTSDPVQLQCAATTVSLNIAGNANKGGYVALNEGTGVYEGTNGDAEAMTMAYTPSGWHLSSGATTWFAPAVSSFMQLFEGSITLVPSIDHSSYVFPLNYNSSVGGNGATLKVVPAYSTVHCSLSSRHGVEIVGAESGVSGVFFPSPFTTSANPAYLAGHMSVSYSTSTTTWSIVHSSGGPDTVYYTGSGTLASALPYAWTPVNGASTEVFVNCRDRQSPSIVSISSAIPSDHLTIDESIELLVTFSEVVAVQGSITLSLNTGGEAVMVGSADPSTSGAPLTAVARFMYTVKDTDTSVAALDVT
ncbi:unnamed protein product, partial [Symbiodinium sp. KB8]